MTFEEWWGTQARKSDWSVKDAARRSWDFYEDCADQLGILEGTLKNREQLIEWQVERIKELEKRLAAAPEAHTRDAEHN